MSLKTRIQKIEHRLKPHTMSEEEARQFAKQAIEWEMFPENIDEEMIVQWIMTGAFDPIEILGEVYREILEENSSGLPPLPSQRIDE